MWKQMIAKRSIDVNNDKEGAQKYEINRVGVGRRGV